MRAVARAQGIVLLVACLPFVSQVAVASTNAPPQANPAPGESSASEQVLVTPVVTSLSDGSPQTVYTLPDGEVVTIVTPPSGFDPLTASDAKLAEYDFPSRPTDDADLVEWRQAMSAVQRVGQPSGPVSVDVGDAVQRYATVVSNWGGVVAGNTSGSTNTYVAVKGNLTIPSTGTCDSTNGVGAWIGLGGVPPKDLVQQGVECGHASLGSGSGFHPFTEFVDASSSPAGWAPAKFCMIDGWTLPVGHVIYQNMSYQTSSNTAYFFLEDESSGGLTESCHISRPSSAYTFAGNTAEWITEAPLGELHAVDFGTIGFSNAQLELNSSGTWANLNTQALTKYKDGWSSSDYCVYPPGSLGSDGKSFSDVWYSGDCYYELH